MIKYNVPPFTGDELKYIEKAILNEKICGDGEFTEKCSEWMKKYCNCNNVFLTTSCTSALEMSVVLADLKPGDEVIMPSYTFVSTADAFVLRGVKVVFIDIRPDTLNMDENLIEEAITDKTKAICPVHYAGVACEMDKINKIAKKYGLKVIEDAAQGLMSTYKGKALGTLSDFGNISFHETKNYSMGEGGAIFFNDDQFKEKAEIIREKGTNRSKFFRGEIDKYTWVDWGSSYLPSDINAAYLWPQLLIADKIYDNRMATWNFYNENLKELADNNQIELPYIPKDCVHNAHMFYLKTNDINERTDLLNYLKSKGIQAVFHYIPLHSVPAGKKFARFNGEDKFTTTESERIVRLPIYYNLKADDAEKIVKEVCNFYSD